VCDHFLLAVCSFSSGLSYGKLHFCLNANGNTFANLKFHNDSTFQIISPGSDGVFGAVVSTNSNSPGENPVYFVSETGVAVGPNGAPSIRAFQDVDWLSSITVNGHLDNLTNFSSSTLESDLP